MTWLFVAAVAVAWVAAGVMIALLVGGAVRERDRHRH